MGHKVNPYGIRLGITTDWRARWYAKPKDYANNLYLDLLARAHLEKNLKSAGVGDILIERLSEGLSQQANVVAYVARPGMVIGKKGGLVESLKKQLEKIMDMPVNLTIYEVRKPELDAKLVAENIAGQLERRIMFRRAIKRAGDTAMRMGALGVKIIVSGRLGGAEIARSACYQKGRMPLHTFRAKINYDVASAKTTYGIVGVKVLIFVEEFFAKTQALKPGAWEEKMKLGNIGNNSDKRSRRRPKEGVKKNATIDA